MQKLTVYTYRQCQTCKKAVKFLAEHGLAYTEHPIVETPPSLGELKTMLAAYDGQIKKLFNTSGELYREMNLSAKLSKLTDSEALALLAKHGKLIKRPFLLQGKGEGLVGFKEDEWRAQLLG